VNWVIHEPDASGFSEPQLANLSGLPVMVYRTSNAVRFARTISAGVPETTADWTWLDIENTFNHEFPRVIVDDGLPAVAFQHKQGTHSVLAYMYADSATPDLLSNWSYHEVDADVINSGEGLTLTTVDGMPAIAYRNTEIVDYLCYAQALVAQPTSDSEWNIINVRSKPQTHVGQWVSLVGVDKLPLMAYVNTGSGSTGGLQVSYADTDPPTGEGDFDSSILDPTEVGYSINEQTSSIILTDGTPVILYRTNQGLKFSYWAEP
jgi:hypothetical protein